MHFDGWTLVLQTVNFAVLVWLLHRFLYKPVLGMIDARKAEIQAQYDAAKAAHEKATAAQVQIESERSGIVAERESALKLVAKEAQEALQAQRSQSGREAQAALEATRKVLAAERERALTEARHLAWDLATDIARRLLAEIPIKLRAEAWLERIEEYLRALPTPQLDPLVKQLADGSVVQVVTATVLPPDVTERWSARLRAVLGGGAALTFAVQSELIAGAELHFPIAVLRFSYLDAMTALRAESESCADAR